MRKVAVVLILSAVLGLATAQLSGSQQQQPDPCQHKHRVVGDVQYCDRYWECVGGQAQLYDCPNGLVFVGRNRGIAEGCDYPWRGGHCDNKIQINPAIPTEHCDWLYGIFGHETSCTRYWTCWNGTAAEQFCIGGLLYNEETHACDWPQNVAGCQKHPLCKDDPNANVPLGKSCERYWACQGGYPRLQRCPATLVFDKKSRRCVAPPTEDCDVPSTTPPPPEERQSGQQFKSSNPARGNIGGQQGRPQVQQQQQRRQQLQQDPPQRRQQLQQDPPQRRQQLQHEAPPPRRQQLQQQQPNFNLPDNAQPLPLQIPNSNPIDLSQRSFRVAPIPGAIPIPN